MSERFLICAFAEPQAVGTTFIRKDWPLHITIVLWCKLTHSEVTLQKALQKELLNHKSFVSHVVHQSITRYVFPPRRVSVLEPQSWIRLHRAMLAIVARYAHTTTARLLTAPYYRPHLTFQNQGHMRVGDSITCDSLYLVRKRGAHYTVTARLPLGETV